MTPREPGACSAHTWRANRLRLLIVAVALFLWGALLPIVYDAFGEQFEQMMDSGLIPEEFTNFGGGDMFSLTGSVRSGSSTRSRSGCASCSRSGSRSTPSPGSASAGRSRCCSPDRSRAAACTRRSPSRRFLFVAVDVAGPRARDVRRRGADRPGGRARAPATCRCVWLNAFLLYGAIAADRPGRVGLVRPAGAGHRHLAGGRAGRRTSSTSSASSGRTPSRSSRSRCSTTSIRASSLAGLPGVERLRGPRRGHRRGRRVRPGRLPAPGPRRADLGRPRGDARRRRARPDTTTARSSRAEARRTRASRRPRRRGPCASRAATARRSSVRSTWASQSPTRPSKSFGTSVEAPATAVPAQRARRRPPGRPSARPAASRCSTRGTSRARRRPAPAASSASRCSRSRSSASRATLASFRSPWRPRPGAPQGPRAAGSGPRSSRSMSVHRRRRRLPPERRPAVEEAIADRVAVGGVAPPPTAARGAGSRARADTTAAAARPSRSSDVVSDSLHGSACSRAIATDDAVERPGIDDRIVIRPLPGDELGRQVGHEDGARRRRRPPRRGTAATLPASQVSDGLARVATPALAERRSSSVARAIQSTASDVRFRTKRRPRVSLERR